MCGITGFFAPLADQHEGEMTDRINRMSSAIRSRGPDDYGFWLDKSAGLAMGHRRLAILDLSPAGHQPMSSPSGRYVLVFNGEIYNHALLRKELSGIPWKGHSDTETLLAAFEHWGFEETLKRCIGMFALALWDRETRELLLARDRMGEKPLYYGWQGQGDKAVFLFGSELKALKQHPSFIGSIYRDALTLFLRHNYIPAPYTIYERVYKLLPGTWVSLSERDREPTSRTYWSFPHIATQPKRENTHPHVIVDELEALLSSAVKMQSLADVPLGAFLSGGIDSSTIVALMQKQSSTPIKTFSIGFHEKEYNEAHQARAVAAHLGTDHTELYVSAEQARGVIPKLPQYYDEPFADSSQIPTFLVSQLASQHVTVALSGDAGDELFCGYNRYVFSAQLWKKIELFPFLLKSMAARGIRLLPPKAWNTCSKVLPLSKRRGNIGDLLHKGSQVLLSPDINQAYLALVSYWDNPSQLVIAGKEPPTFLNGAAPDFSALSSIEKMMALDCMSYLPDDILVKVDRAAMALSLEVRVPFLDHRVIDYAWSLPLDLKLRNGVSKWPLRQILYKYVPEKLMDRPKMGFAVPIAEWLRGPLKEWGDHLLNEPRMAQDGFFNTAPIRRMWTEHLSGKRNAAQPLWGIFMFQSWLDEQKR